MRFKHEDTQRLIKARSEAAQRVFDNRLVIWKALYG